MVFMINYRSFKMRYCWYTTGINSIFELLGILIKNPETRHFFILKLHLLEKILNEIETLTVSV